MTEDEALDLALAALKELVAQTETGLFAIRHDHVAMNDARQAITAIKQARALDKKADNARELGLDYEPVALDALVKEEMRYYHDGHYIDSSDAKYQLLSFAHRVAKLYTTPPATQPAPDLQAELEATNRQVEILSDALAESRREIAQLKSQRQWFGLTLAEIEAFEKGSLNRLALCCAIEAKLKEKNT